MKQVRGQQQIEQSYSQFLADESRISPTIPAAVYFPESTVDVSLALKSAAEQGRSCTISAGRTGIGGGAVPADGETLLISLEALQPPVALGWNDDYRCWYAKTGAGLRLQDLISLLKRKQYRLLDTDPETELFFPVDPTETTATLGGMAATNASGARTLFFGPMRKWIIGCTVVLADGSILSLRRGEYMSSDGKIIIPGAGGANPLLEIPVSPVAIPPTKHTGGYQLTEETDLIDLFIGSEGTLGVITGLELRLMEPAPENLYGVIFLQQDEPTKIVDLLLETESFSPIALEYMDSRSLQLLRDFRADQAEASGVPLLPEHTEAALYIELACKDKEAVQATAGKLAELLEAAGISPRSVWTGFSSQTLESMKKFRHALPERINSIIAERKKSIPGLTKIGTDMAVPVENLNQMLREYRTGLEKRHIQYAIFGHIGDGHVHVNMLPANEAEMKQGWELYTEFARSVKSKNGSICAEHGIGRLKRKLLPIQYTAEEIAAMKRVKAVLDPQGRLNPGVLFPDEI